MQNIKILENALAAQYLTVLRNKESNIQSFRFALERLGEILAIESAKDLPTENIQIETPLEITEGKIIKNSLVIIPVLRAGLSLLNPFLRYFPEAKIGFIGQQRDEKTALPSEYYRNFPDLKNHKILIIDPMLATGGTIASTIASILDLGGSLNDIQVSCLIAAPEGIRKVHEAYPSLPILTASLDRALDENKYILPGLGDAGDLWAGTS